MEIKSEKYKLGILNKIVLVCNTYDSDSVVTKQVKDFVFDYLAKISNECIDYSIIEEKDLVLKINRIAKRGDLVSSVNVTFTEECIQSIRVNSVYSVVGLATNGSSAYFILKNGRGYYNIVSKKDIPNKTILVNDLNVQELLFNKYHYKLYANRNMYYSMRGISSNKRFEDYTFEGLCLLFDNSKSLETVAEDTIRLLARAEKLVKLLKNQDGDLNEKQKSALSSCECILEEYSLADVMLLVSKGEIGLNRRYRVRELKSTITEDDILKLLKVNYVLSYTLFFSKDYEYTTSQDKINSAYYSNEEDRFDRMDRERRLKEARGEILLSDVIIGLEVGKLERTGGCFGGCTVEYVLNSSVSKETLDNTINKHKKDIATDALKLVLNKLRKSNLKAFNKTKGSHLTANIVYNPRFFTLCVFVKLKPEVLKAMGEVE